MHKSLSIQISQVKQMNNEFFYDVSNILTKSFGLQKSFLITPNVNGMN